MLVDKIGDQTSDSATAANPTGPAPTTTTSNPHIPTPFIDTARLTAEEYRPVSMNATIDSGRCRKVSTGRSKPEGVC
ncbi:hypothetical protein GCM10023148_01310 [Actinokineospora soli]